MRGAYRTVAAWGAVHPSRPAAAALAAVCATSLLLPDTAFASIGITPLARPVSLLLVLPAVAGTAAGLACDNRARLPQPNPVRSWLARAAWFTGWSVAAVLAAATGLLTGADVAGTAVGRNVILHAALALVVVRSGAASLAWLPTFGYALLSMIFGCPGGGAPCYWWAVLVTDQVSTGQVVTVAGLWLVAAGWYAVLPAPGTRQGRRAGISSVVAGRRRRGSR